MRLTHNEKTTSRRRAALISAGLLSFAALALALAGPSEPELEATPEAAPHRANLARHALRLASTEPGTLCAFEPGARMAYAVHAQTEVDIDFSRMHEDEAGLRDHAQAELATSKAQSHLVSRDWTLELEALAHDADGSTILAARIEDHGAEILAEGAQPSTPSAGLAETFLVRVDPRCSLVEYGWRSDAQLDAVREQQLMVGGLGFRAPRELANSSHYAGLGFDATGRYRATYHYDEEQSTLRGELETFSLGDGRSSGVPIGLEILASTIEVELTPGAWFERLTNERDLEMTLDGRAFGTHFRSTKATRTELGEFEPVVELDDGGWTWGQAPAAPTDHSGEFDPALVDLPLDDALARYRELVAEGTVADYGTLLTGWLRANPAGADELLERLREGEFAEGQLARAGVFFALGSANTAEAQAALVDLLASEGERINHQIAAAHALALVDAPTGEMVELLAAASMGEALHSVERGSMALALGTLAQSSETHDPEVAAMARAEISGWLTEPGETRELGASLLAAGNAGHDALAADVARYLDHEDPTIRRHATHALRQMSPEEALPRLEPQLADVDQVVRTSALETATTVVRKHGQAPPEALVELAASALPEAGDAEAAAALALLGEASKYGSTQADEVLRERLDTQLDGERDAKRLAALGRHLPRQWKAAN